jgi:carboxyl-terminal processing protease
LEPLELVVIRDEISLYTIKYVFHLDRNIGYIRINKFSETTGEELNDALEKLDEEHLSGLILDLRDKPGGALNQALAVSDRFLQKGQVIVNTRGRSSQGREFRAQTGRSFEYPMVVLINRNSASASEIVSGALQDHDRALIVGETSFGKALVQTIYPLEGNRGLALTTGQYYTPSNRLIQRDYSASFYDYFFSREDTLEGEGEAHHTDSGREVFGGGGITPDEQVSLESYPKLIRTIERERLFVEFVDKLIAGAIQSSLQFPEVTPENREELMEGLAVTDEVLGLFKTFLLDKEADVTDQSFEESRQVIANRIKQRLFLNLFGDEESFKVALEVDQQVLRAIELLPEATALTRNNIAKKQ